MIVGFQPGGTIKDARVVLKEGETLPNRFNAVGTIVYTEDEFGAWLLVKDKGELLPCDHPMLSQPEFPPTEILDLTNDENCATFEHTDIIRLDPRLEPPVEDDYSEESKP